MNYAFLIMGDYSPLRDRASMAGESVRMIGVSGLEEACRIAGELAAEGMRSFRRKRGPEGHRSRRREDPGGICGSSAGAGRAF